MRERRLFADIEAPSVPEFLKLTADKSTGVVYNLLGGPLNTPENPRAAEILGERSARRTPTAE